LQLEDKQICFIKISDQFKFGYKIFGLKNISNSKEQIILQAKTKQNKTNKTTKKKKKKKPHNSLAEF